VKLDTFPVRDGNDIYEGIKKIDWSTYMNVDQTFAVRCTLSSTLFDNNLFPALKAKDAIADQFREAKGVRPDVHRTNPDLDVNLFVFRGQCQVSINSSGSSLHLRGYRKDVDKAPLSEVLAAGLVLLSGWEPHMPLVDFMCGSGTIPIEAALIAAKIPPGTFRDNFAFERWPDFDADLYTLIREKQMERITDAEVRIVANELNKFVFRKAQENVHAAGVEDMVQLHLGDFRELHHDFKRGVVIINPPYGEKLKVEDVEELYGAIGTHLKHHYAGFKAWIFTGSPEGARAVGLRPNNRIKLFNGPLECRLLGYELFEGKKSERHLQNRE
jgi:putative N6-adenine-specific DNA methylase